MTKFPYRYERRRSEDGNWGKGNSASKEEKGPMGKMGFWVLLIYLILFLDSPSPASRLQIIAFSFADLLTNAPNPFTPPCLCPCWDLSLEYRLSTSQPGIWELTFQGSVQNLLALSRLFDKIAQAGGWTLPVLSSVSDLYSCKYCFDPLYYQYFFQKRVRVDNFKWCFVVSCRTFEDSGSEERISG